VSTRDVYANRWLRLREDVVRRRDGSTGIYSVVEKTDFALVIALDDEQVHLVEQFRYPVGQRCVEFPQGTTTAPDPLTVAQRELAEETGLRAASWTHLGRLWTAYGFCNQAYDVFLATGLAPGVAALEPEEQDLRHLVVSRTELDEMVADGRLTDAHSVAAYALLLRHERRRAGG
jgi:8-oxo-dGTP pyrophosphatase MutT (NUDIX family)